ncbi:MAG: GGDEF domain-containing protein [Deltaproteobacteria bacterium]|nr:GGDEF domain-containing protein [Deltaproteobacteria bacterium]
MAKSEFGDDVEKTTILGLKELELLSPQNAHRSAYLIVINGRAVGKMFKLSGTQLVVGRSPQNEILVDDEGVSRQHARVERTLEGWCIVDNNSTNGVFVNGTRVVEHRLEDGEKIQLGSSAILKFSYQDEVEERAQKQLYESATRDGLTTCFNKKYFADQLKTEFAFYYRHQDPLSLSLFDIDFFKKLNDGYGHQAGDYVLKNLAGIVQSALRTEDVLARYGGEEFGIIFKSTDSDRAFAVMERVRRKVESYEFLYESKRLPVTVSIGIATLKKQNYATPKLLVKAADDYLYKAKGNGRNRTESDLLG